MSLKAPNPIQKIYVQVSMYNTRSFNPHNTKQKHKNSNNCMAASHICLCADVYKEGL